MTGPAPPADALARYNTLWQAGKCTTPLVILIGGAAGVGKSTLAQRLAAAIPHLSPISTSVLRAAARVFLSPAENPSLFRHTFDLESTEAFLEQAAPITRVVNQLIAFARTERQHTLIEGSNLLPGRFPAVEGVALVEVYLKVSDPAQHRRMLGGPTHNRVLSAAQAAACRRLEEYLVAEAERHGRPVFEYTEAYPRTLALIGETVAPLVAGEPD